MSRILFINDMPLANARRGTPIRINHLLREIRKNHELMVCSQNVPEEFSDIFISYPKLKSWDKIVFFKKKIKDQKIDVVFTCTEINIKLPIILKFLTGVKIAIDLHGLYTEELYFAKKIGHIKKVSLNLITYILLFFYDRILTVSEKLKNYYFSHKNREVVIYGGVDIESFPKNIPQEPHVFTMGYMGNTRPYQGLEELLAAVTLLKSKSKFPFSLNLILSDADISLNKKLEELNLFKETSMVVDVSQELAFEYILNSTVVIIPRPKIKVTDYAYPSKLPEFLYTGRPLILTDVGPVSEFENINEFAIVISNENIVDRLVKAIEDAEEMTKAKRNLMGQKARNFVENNLTWQKIGLKASRALVF